MADFAADFRRTSQIWWPTTDPFDFSAVFAPFVEDLDPPVIKNISPPPAGALGKDEHITLDIVDSRGAFAIRDFWLGFGDTPTAYELVHNGTEFLGSYVDDSTIVPITKGYTLSLRRTGGWPSGKLRLRAYVVDSSGNMAVVDG